MSYKFPVPHRNQEPAVKAGVDTVQVGDEELGTIQGVSPGSKEEWRVAVALSNAGIQFQYQVSIYGGSSRRGGQTIDFVLYVPFAQPLQVFGEYWHESEMDEAERFNLARIQQVYKRPAWVLWGEELQTQQMADAAIRGLF